MYVDIAVKGDKSQIEELAGQAVLRVIWLLNGLPYFFGYQTEFFSFQNNLKDLDPSYKTDLDLWDYLDPSYKTDLDLWDCLGRVKLVL